MMWSVTVDRGGKERALVVNDEARARDEFERVRAARYPFGPIRLKRDGEVVEQFTNKRVPLRELP